MTCGALVRERTIVALVGGPGSGKSTLAKALVASARRRDQRVRIIDPGRQFVAGEMPSDVDAWLVERREKSDSDLLVLDDVDAYVGATMSRDSPWRDLALRNRWWRVDVLLTARRLQSLPPVLLSAVSVLFVFRLSPADQAGRQRLKETLGSDLELPSHPYRFVRCDVFGGARQSGRVLQRGGFVLEDGK